MICIIHLQNMRQYFFFVIHLPSPLPDTSILTSERGLLNSYAHFTAKVYKLVPNNKYKSEFQQFDRLSDIIFSQIY